MPTITKSEIDEALKDVIDPELGVNVVDLGLVYNIHIDKDEDNPEVGPDIVVDMTLTTPACPLTDLIEEQVDDAIKPLGAANVRVQWVWSPPWGLDMITEDGRDQLRMVGFNF
ncbi:MAG: metal-sulfur cluster assembly factor [Cellulomonadaceae bacterium]|jgi:metal-sulfur cluster biosynthetic enzyme|nr:metal-sulfur cluster assembly factor [Cellulomonadaceae bacterium]